MITFKSRLQKRRSPSKKNLLRRLLRHEDLEGRLLLAGLADKFESGSALIEPSASEFVGSSVQIHSGTIESTVSTGPVYDEEPPLTAEQQALIDADPGSMPDPTFYMTNSLVSSDAVLSNTSETVAGAEPASLKDSAAPAAPVVSESFSPLGESGAESSPPEAPGTLRFFRNTDLAPPSSSSSNTSEPSAASLDQAIFQTHNWNAARSLDNGLTWTNVSPYTTFPSVFGGFCCDQRVAHDDSRDMLLWYLQYIKTGSTASDTNGVRIARVNTTTQLASNTWTSYVFTPNNFGYGTGGEWLDFPDMEVTNGFAYFTSNIFSTVNDSFVAAVMWRIPLADLEAGGTANFSYFTSTAGTIGMTTNAGDTMYGATVISATSLRVWTWPDSGNVVTNDVTGLATTYFGTHTSLDIDGNNWTGRADSRVSTGWNTGSQIGFMWNSAESAANNRPKPFVRTVILNAATKAIVSQPDVWSSTVTWHYPAISSNASGDLGGTIGYNFPNAAVGTQILIDDEYTTGWSAVFGSLGTSGPGQSRWGDYLDARPDDDFPRTWIATGFHSSAANSPRTTPDFFWFGREEDSPTGPLRLKVMR